MSCSAFLGASFRDYFVALRCREFRLAGKDLASAMDETLPRKRARTLKREASGDGSLMLSASSRVTSSQDVVDGALLPFLARQNLENFKTALSFGDSLVPLGVPGQSRGPEALDLTWASCCSGSEGVKYVVEAANLAMAEQGFSIEFHHKFSCEISKPKQKWIKAVLHSGPLFDSSQESVPLPAAGCCFEDIGALGETYAKCTEHGNKCLVPSVDCLFLGTSCKDLSRANSSVDRSQLVFHQKRSKGASAQTFRGMLDYCKGHRPTLIIYENVDAVDDKVSTTTATNLSLLMQAMGDLQYEGQKVMTDGQEFGLPCRRRRLYVLFVDVSSRKVDLRFEAIGRVFGKFRTLVTSCMRSPPCVKDCLLPKDQHGDILAKALAEHTAASEKNSQKKGQPQNSWIDRHISYAEQLGVRWNGPVAEDLQQNDWHEILTGREADALVLSRVADPSCLFRNLSQSVGRINAKSSGGKEIAPTMMPGQLLWVEGVERLLTGEEALILQGFPILKFLNKVQGTMYEESWQQNFLQDLAGNAMALPVALAIFQAGLASVPWARLPEAPAERSTIEDEEDIAVVMAAMEVLQNGADA